MGLDGVGLVGDFLGVVPATDSSTGRNSHRHGQQCALGLDVGLSLGFVGMTATERRRILTAPRRHHHVDHRTDEHERRGERVDPDTGDQRGGVAAHQLDAEAADAVGGDVQREQSAVTQLEAAVGPEQQEENQEVPQQFVEERRVHDVVDLPGRDPVEQVRIDHTGAIAALEDLQTPRQIGRPAVQLLVEVVAQPADGLGQDHPGCDGIAERGQRNSVPAAADPRADAAECDRTPDAQAAVPDSDGTGDARAALGEVGTPIGHQVVQATTDETERHRPQRDVVDDALFTAARHPAAIADDERRDDAGDDAERVRPDRYRPQVPDALGRTRDVCQQRCGHAGTFCRTPWASSSDNARTAGMPPSPSADTSAEPTMTPSA